MYNNIITQTPAQNTITFHQLKTRTRTHNLKHQHETETQPEPDTIPTAPLGIHLR